MTNDQKPVTNDQSGHSHLKDEQYFVKLLIDSLPAHFVSHPLSTYVKRGEVKKQRWFIFLKGFAEHLYIKILRRSPKASPSLCQQRGGVLRSKTGVS